MVRWPSKCRSTKFRTWSGCSGLPRRSTACSRTQTGPCPTCPTRPRSRRPRCRLQLEVQLARHRRQCLLVPLPASPCPSKPHRRRTATRPALEAARTLMVLRRLHSTVRVRRCGILFRFLCVRCSHFHRPRSIPLSRCTHSVNSRSSPRPRFCCSSVGPRDSQRRGGAASATAATEAPTPARPSQASASAARTHGKQGAAPHRHRHARQRRP